MNMFSVLSKLKYRINKDINQAEKHWDTNPGNDYRRSGRVDCIGQMGTTRREKGKGELWSFK